MSSQNALHRTNSKRGWAALFIGALGPTAWTAQGGQLSMQFAGSGHMVTLAPSATAQIDVLWTFGPFDFKARLTGLDVSFRVQTTSPGPSDLEVTSVSTAIPGWTTAGSVPAPLENYSLGVGDPNGISGPTSGSLVVASLVIRRQNVPGGSTDCRLIAFRHDSPGDSSPTAHQGITPWTFRWQQPVSGNRQFNLGQGNPGDADPVWPVHGLEPFQPLVAAFQFVGPDCNGNGIPDDCEALPDCQGNGIPDTCDLVFGTSQDCQPNGVPDECDIAAGISTDADGNAIPDECQLQACCSDNPMPPPQQVCAMMVATACSNGGGFPMGLGSRCVGNGFFNPDENPFEPDACHSVIVNHATDEFITPPDGAQFDFCETPIPADFFDPGSLPFDGLMFLGGAASPDTKVLRMRDEWTFPPQLPTGSNPPVISIQMVDLNLVGTRPIEIAYCDGHTEVWDVSTCGLSGPQGLGDLTATRTHENGGTFEAEFPVQAFFVFVRQADGLTRVLDTYKEGLDPIRLGTHQPAAFTFVPNPSTVAQVSLNMAPNFVPGLEEDPDSPGYPQCCKLLKHSAASMGYGAGHIHIAGLDCTDCEKGACCDGGTCFFESFPDCLNRTGDPDAYKGNGTNCDDGDSDGLADALESNDCCQTSQPCATSTSPHIPDTDGDGCSDGAEVLSLATNPCDACDPLTPPASCSPPALDCNANGMHDDCEVALGLAPDCNANGTPDGCDLAAGRLSDGNGDGIADQCQFGLLITEVVAGPLPGGLPRWAELSNCGPAPVDLIDFSILVFENGFPGPAGSGSWPMGGLLNPGQSYVLAWESQPTVPAISVFEDVYGFSPDQFIPPPNIDGADAVGLFLGSATWLPDGSLSGTLYDVYGVPTRDGAGRRWEYTDGYAHRDRAQMASGMFNSNGWYFSGPDALESDPPGDPAAERLLLQTLTQPYAYECGLAFCDCNHNGFDDYIDLSTGASDDCNSTGIPDECESCGSPDFDADGDVDLADYGAFEHCLSGPGAAPPTCTDACLNAFDLDGDGDVDLLDFADFAQIFNAAVQPAPLTDSMALFEQAEQFLLDEVVAALEDMSTNAAANATSNALETVGYMIARARDKLLGIDDVEVEWNQWWNSLPQSVRNKIDNFEAPFGLLYHFLVKTIKKRVAEVHEALLDLEDAALAFKADPTPANKDAVLRRLREVEKAYDALDSALGKLKKWLQRDCAPQRPAFIDSLTDLISLVRIESLLFMVYREDLGG